MKAQLKTGKYSARVEMGDELAGDPVPAEGDQGDDAGKLKVIESSEIDEKEASPMLLRFSLGRCRSAVYAGPETCPAVCLCADPHLMSHSLMTTEATMPTVAAVMASESISSMPYLPDARRWPPPYRVLRKIHWASRVRWRRSAARSSPAAGAPRHRPAPIAAAGPPARRPTDGRCCRALFWPGVPRGQGRAPKTSAIRMPA